MAFLPAIYQPVTAAALLEWNASSVACGAESACKAVRGAKATRTNSKRARELMPPQQQEAAGASSSSSDAKKKGEQSQEEAPGSVEIDPAVEEAKLAVEAAEEAKAVEAAKAAVANELALPPLTAAELKPRPPPHQAPESSLRRRRRRRRWRRRAQLRRRSGR